MCKSILECVNVAGHLSHALQLHLKYAISTPVGVKGSSDGYLTVLWKWPCSSRLTHYIEKGHHVNKPLFLGQGHTGIHMNLVSSFSSICS